MSVFRTAELDAADAARQRDPNGFKMLVATGGHGTAYHSSHACPTLHFTGNLRPTRAITSVIAALRGLHPCRFCHGTRHPRRA